MRSVYLNGKYYTIAVLGNDNNTVIKGGDNPINPKIYILNNDIDPLVDTITYTINGGSSQTSTSKVITVNYNDVVDLTITKNGSTFNETITVDSSAILVYPDFAIVHYTYVLSEECEQINYTIVDDTLRINSLNTDETSIVLPRLYHT